MSENILSFNGSEEFRKRLIKFNLKPYNIEGSFTSSVDPQNYEVVQGVQVPIDLDDISTEVETEAKSSTIPNRYHTNDYIDAGTIVGYPIRPTPVSLDLRTANALRQSSEYPQFVISNYSPVDILNSNPVISQDSYLQQLAAAQLRGLFEERIAVQVERYTVGRVNFQAFEDPFSASLLVSGQQPLVYQDYTITVPDGAIDMSVFWLERLTGTYFPVSPIEGEYFTQPERQKTKAGQLLANTTVGKLTGKFFNKLKNLVNPSEKFLQNTGSGQRSAMFNNIGYNRFKPPYVSQIQGIQAVANLFNKGESLTNYYIGSEQAELQEINSPPDQVPTDAYGNVTGTIVYGPDRAGKLYEGDNNYQFGLAGKSYTERPSFDGGFVWGSTDTNADAGKKIGQGGESFGQSDTFNQISPFYEQVLSSNYEFKPGSILDETQRIIDSTPKKGGDRLSHVGNAINQVSKVFFDGYKEITKGSKVRRFVNKNGKEVGQEYGRVFTKDTPYFTYSNLQSTIANTSGNETNGNIRRFSYSVLDSTYNLNIAPVNKKGSTNILNPQSPNASVKKYMFSIENLAWKGSAEYNELPECEKGPNGGRVMWFPPYELSFDDDSTPSFTDNEFLGRPEPIYTYKNTKRSGNLSFKIVVDHPSVLNLIVNKALQNENSQTVNEVVDSFFAGLKKYDIYELARRFNTLDLKTLQEAYQEVLQNPNSTNEQLQLVGQAINSNNDSPVQNPEQTFNSEYENYGFYFNDTIGGGGYGNAYDEYVNNLPVFLQQSGDLSGQCETFFNTVIETNNSQVDTIIDEISSILTSKKGQVKVILYGTKKIGTSDAGSQNFVNSELESVKTWIYSRVIEGGTLEKYGDKELIIVSEPELSSNAEIKGGNFDAINCNQTLGGLQDVYSPTAMACRALRFKNIIITPFPPDNSVQGDNQTNQSNPNQQTLIGNKPKQTINETNISQNITKKVLRGLLKESDYFEMLNAQSPFVYDSIKTKIKYFHPAFHSITPEGLNSRLVFLNQCTRPGNTIPTKTDTGKLITSDSFNTNFGRPPILILRIGDFFNTKIVPNSIKFDYDEDLLDLNPEGIGIQPMIASVTMSFDMIGGHGLKEPVAKLQNALSFNYYANTEMYDDRADVTEDTTVLDSAFLNAIVNQEPLAGLNDVNNILQNDGGTTIGTITLNVPSGATQTGDIQYTQFFGTAVESAKSYFTNITNTYKTIIEEYNYGIWKQIITERNYSTGYFDNLKNPSTNEVKILGKPKNVEQRLLALKDQIISDIDSENDTIISSLDSDPYVTNSDVNVVKNNYTNFINDYYSSEISSIFTTIQSVSDLQAESYQVFRKLDLISNLTDGKILTNGQPKVYIISGISSSDVELTTDYTEIATNFQNYYTLLGSNNIIVDGLENSTLFTPISGGLSDEYNNRTFTLLSKVFLDIDLRNNFKSKLTENLSSSSSGTTVGLVDNICENLATIFDEEYNLWLTQFNTFIEGTDYQTYKDYNPQVNGITISNKERLFTFNTSGATETQGTQIKSIYQTVNENSDLSTYNGKKIFE